MTANLSIRLIALLCLVGQMLVAVLPGGGVRLCVACGPTICAGPMRVDEPPPCATPKHCSCCAEKPKAPPVKRESEKCCCKDAVPMAESVRRVEIVATAAECRMAVQPMLLVAIAPLELVIAREMPRMSRQPDDPGRRQIAGVISTTRLLI